MICQHENEKYFSILLIYFSTYAIMTVGGGQNEGNCRQNQRSKAAKGMTQDELAKAIGLKSRSSINKMEKNAYEIGLDRLKEIARVLDVDPDYLVFGDSEDKKEEINMLFGKLTEAQQDAALAFLRSMIANRE